MTTENKDDSLLTFPCDFSIKVFGMATDEFEATALGIVNKNAPSSSDRAIQSNLSANGKYRALTITVHVESREQLDQIYRDLTASPLVLMAL